MFSFLHLLGQCASKARKTCKISRVKKTHIFCDSLSTCAPAHLPCVRTPRHYNMSRTYVDRNGYYYEGVGPRHDPYYDQRRHDYHCDYHRDDRRPRCTCREPPRDTRLSREAQEGILQALALYDLVVDRFMERERGFGTRQLSLAPAQPVVVAPPPARRDRDSEWLAAAVTGVDALRAAYAYWSEGFECKDRVSKLA